MNKKFLIILIIAIAVLALFFALNNENEFETENIMFDREEKMQ